MRSTSAAVSPDSLGKALAAALDVSVTLYAPVAASKVPPVAESRAVLVVRLASDQPAGSLADVPKLAVTFTVWPP